MAKESFGRRRSGMVASHPAGGANKGADKASKGGKVSSKQTKPVKSMKDST